MGSHSYRLDTPPGVHDVFHTQLLRPDASDPLPSQVQDDTHPQPLLIGGQKEWDVEEIRDAKEFKNGKMKYLVKWIGWARPTWEPGSALQGTTALGRWLLGGKK